MSENSAPSTLVVTGGASGFGLAVANECASLGADVALLDIDEDRLRAAAATIEAEHGVRALAVAADLSSDPDLAAAAALVDEELGGCDLLWANVGVQQFGAVEALTDDEWRWVLDVNVVGAARTVRAFLPLLRRSGRARLVFTSSANALAPAARLGAYQASKFAVVGLAETLRLELAGDGIGVSVVYPSGMFTRHLESSANARPGSLGDAGDVSEDLEAMMASRPMTEEDLTTAEVAAANAVAGVLAGAPHVITHGALDAAVLAHQAELRAALARVGARRPTGDPSPAEVR